MINNNKLQSVKFLWLGPWHSDKALYGRKAVNQAASAWSRGLLHGLSQAGCDIRVCTHCREQYWPNGEIWPGHGGDFDRVFPLNYIKYVNLPGIRRASLIRAYRRMVAREITDFKPDVVLSYNLYSYHCCISDIVVDAGVKWIPVILDQDDPQRDNWQKFLRDSQGASAYVILSYWGYINCPSKLPILHLDGGVEKWRGSEEQQTNIKTVVYSGQYNDRYGGLDVLFRIFKAVKTQECQFVLTGKDPKDELRHYIPYEKRAQYLGFLKEEELDKIYGTASVFINPRPPDVSDNKMIFPSKLLKYLSYGKPVVSTWTDGLAPEFKKILLCSESVADYVNQTASLVDQALAMPRNEQKILCARTRNWVESGRTWKAQAQRLVDWLNTAVCSG
ncbi:MAG: glycosyltransferase [Kiritimatiellae bacterium]|jgi:glycosyltransferase involved in cell wall biosynthesis|nr:glycosyltransferase [Kiritimatiellia bacterium]